MALAAKISKEQFEALAEHFKPEYVQKDGNYLLDVTPTDGFALENVDGLKSALGATKTERDNAVKLSKQFEGINVDEAKEAVEKLKQFQSFDPEKKIEEGIKAQKEELVNQHNKAMSVKDDSISKLTDQVERHLIDASANAAIVEAKGNNLFLMPHIKDQVKMKEVDGKYIAQVLDGAGNARIGDTQGNLMTVAQLVTEMKGKPEFASAFEGTGMSGTTTKPGSSTDNTNTTPKPGEKTIIDSTDQQGMNDSLEDIATGKATVEFNNTQ